MPFITCTFLNTWSDKSGFSAGACALTIAVLTRHASSPAAATAVFIDPSFMPTPAALRTRPSKKKGRDGAAQCVRKKTRPRLLGGRGRLTEVRGAVNLLAGIGHRDLRALREVHVRVAALDDAANQRDRHARLHGRG